MYRADYCLKHFKLVSYIAEIGLQYRNKNMFIFIKKKNLKSTFFACCIFSNNLDISLVIHLRDNLRC